MYYKNVRNIIKYMELPKKFIRNPALLKELFRYIKNDLMALRGCYDYDYPILFIAGLPKSGTTWLRNMMAQVPGYNIRPINDPDGVTLRHDISEDVFLLIPRWGYTILKLHTRYSEENLRIIRRHVPKFIVMIRDLRDMCLSRYFHVKADPTHRHNVLYRSLSFDEGLHHCIEVVKDAYVSWVKDWLDIGNENIEQIMLIRYEDLNRYTYDTIKKILYYWHLPADDGFISQLIRTKLSSERDLKKECRKSVGGRLSSTARKGIVGDWRNYFKETHKNEFKNIAGDLLISLGYERDYNW